MANKLTEVISPNGVVSWAKSHHLIAVILEEGEEVEGSAISLCKVDFSKITVDGEGFKFQEFLQEIGINLTNQFEKQTKGMLFNTMGRTQAVWNFMVTYFQKAKV